MKKGKSTFEEKQRYVNEVLNAFRTELEEKLQESKGEIERIKYFEKCYINGIQFDGLFITTEKDVEGQITYHIYLKSASNEIASVSQDGKIRTIPDLERYMNNFDLEGTINQNEHLKGALVGTSEKATEKQSKEEMEKKTKSKEEGKKDEELNKQITEDGEDLELTKYRKIRDSHVQERMPEQFSKESEEDGVAYLNKLHCFVMIETVEGKTRVNRNIKPAKMEYRTIISIDEKGEKMERKVPYSLMKTNNSENEIALNLNDFGEIDIETVKVTPCQDRIARGVEMQNEGERGRESYELRRDFKDSGTNYQHEIGHQFREIEEKQIESHEENASEITEQSLVPNTQVTWGELEEVTGKTLVELVQIYNGENTVDRKETFEELPEAIEKSKEYSVNIMDLPIIIKEAKAAKVSISEFMRHMDMVEGATLEEKIGNVHEDIEEEYGGSRKREK